MNHCHFLTIVFLLLCTKISICLSILRSTLDLGPFKSLSENDKRAYSFSFSTSLHIWLWAHPITYVKFVHLCERHFQTIVFIASSKFLLIKNQSAEEKNKYSCCVTYKSHINITIFISLTSSTSYLLLPWRVLRGFLLWNASFNFSCYLYNKALAWLWIY